MVKQATNEQVEMSETGFSVLPKNGSIPEFSIGYKTRERIDVEAALASIESTDKT